MNRSTPGFPVHHQLPEFTQTHVHQVSDAIQPSHPLSSPSPPAPIPPNIRVFSSESTLRMRWPKYWSFSFSIIPSKESYNWHGNNSGYVLGRASLVAQMVKNPPAMWETWIPGLIPGLGRFPGGGMATHSSILAWRIPMDRGAWLATVQRVTKNWTRLSMW